MTQNGLASFSSGGDEAQKPSPINPTSSVDLMTEKDRGLARNAMRSWPARWRGLSDKVKDSFAAGLLEANEAMRSSLAAASSLDEATKASQAIASIARTATMMEGQNQTDYWNADKNERLDAGKATERVGIEPVIVEKPI